MRSLHDKDFVYLSVHVMTQTAKAVRLQDGEGNTEWFPKSQIEDPDEFTNGEHTKVLVPKWLALEKGFPI